MSGIKEGQRKVPGQQLTWMTSPSARRDSKKSLAFRALPSCMPFFGAAPALGLSEDVSGLQVHPDLSRTPPTHTVLCVVSAAIEVHAEDRHHCLSMKTQQAWAQCERHVYDSHLLLYSA